MSKSEISAASAKLDDIVASHKLRCEKIAVLFDEIAKIVHAHENNAQEITRIYNLPDLTEELMAKGGEFFATNELLQEQREQAQSELTTKRTLNYEHIYKLLQDIKNGDSALAKAEHKLMKENFFQILIDELTILPKEFEDIDLIKNSVAFLDLSSEMSDQMFDVCRKKDKRQSFDALQKALQIKKPSLDDALSPPSFFENLLPNISLGSALDLNSNLVAHALPSSGRKRPFMAAESAESAEIKISAPTSLDLNQPLKNIVARLREIFPDDDFFVKPQDFIEFYEYSLEQMKRSFKKKAAIFVEGEKLQESASLKNAEEKTTNNHQLVQTIFADEYLKSAPEQRGRGTDFHKVLQAILTLETALPFGLINRDFVAKISDYERAKEMQGQPLEPEKSDTPSKRPSSPDADAGSLNKAARGAATPD